MYLLIVEDEKNTREAIRDIMCWNKIGITHVDCAADGIEALEKIQKKKPDILLCDIRMPRMDGISLVTSIRELDYPIQVVYLSAYSDKEYLKAAIQFNVVGYVEKPVNIFELESVLAKAVQKCIKEKSHIFKWTEEELVKVLVSEAEISEDAKEYFEYHYFIGPHNGWFCFGYILFSPIEGDSATTESLKKLIKNCLKDYYPCFLVSYTDIHRWNMVLASNSPDNLSIGSHSAFFSKLCRCVSTYTNDKMRPALVMGSVVREIQNIKSSYHSAVLHLDDVFFGGYGRLYPLPESKKLPLDWVQAKIVQFSDIMDEMKHNDILSFVNDVESDLRDVCMQKAHVIQNFYFQILLTAWRSFSKRYAGIPLPNAHDDWLRHINNLSTLKEVSAYVRVEIEKMINNIERYKDFSGPVYQVVKYLENHYSQEINMKVLSQTVNFAPNYLSTLFKKETGCSIRQYLNMIRIERAKEHLSQRNLTLTDIAEKVGFDSYSYFSKVFKKMEGINPAEYRETKQ